MHEHGHGALFQCVFVCVHACVHVCTTRMVTDHLWRCIYWHFWPQQKSESVWWYELHGRLGVNNQVSNKVSNQVSIHLSLENTNLMVCFQGRQLTGFQTQKTPNVGTFLDTILPIYFKLCVMITFYWTIPVYITLCDLDLMSRSQ